MVPSALAQTCEHCACSEKHYGFCQTRHARWSVPTTNVEAHLAKHARDCKTHHLDELTCIAITIGDGQQLCALYCFSLQTKSVITGKQNPTHIFWACTAPNDDGGQQLTSLQYVEVRNEDDVMLRQPKFLTSWMFALEIAKAAGDAHGVLAEALGYEVLPQLSDMRIVSRRRLGEQWLTTKPVRCDPNRKRDGVAWEALRKVSAKPSARSSGHGAPQRRPYEAGSEPAVGVDALPGYALLERVVCSAQAPGDAVETPEADDRWDEDKDSIYRGSSDEEAEVPDPAAACDGPRPAPDPAPGLPAPEAPRIPEVAYQLTGAHEGYVLKDATAPFPAGATAHQKRAASCGRITEWPNPDPKNRSVVCYVHGACKCRKVYPRWRAPDIEVLDGWARAGPTLSHAEHVAACPC